ncbi:hybrid sensor histidine kinase/response regulator transcription factor [Plebeiibacterium sediminum]|uniref:histidine kinase n=1 Tax=Plebeiibacterium sediminum TaxID=2992112 RepID=A0AAE3M2C3_9BACT|nr:two-component regulator propeller domain-containing protein [Plebeiobacterium sediminum]MCW3785828.1 response regulator [Plebeiobacterium sediminum]
MERVNMHLIVRFVMSYARVFLLMGVLFFALNLFAIDYKIKNVESTNRLSHLSVQCIAKDSTGFLWVGTKDGLNRFDGYQYISYKYDPENKNSVSNNEISCLEVQRDSFLWIGTRGGGINRLGLKNGSFKRYPYDTFDGFVRDISIDKNQDVWAATSVGLLKYNKQKDQFINVTEGAVFRKFNNEPFIPRDRNISAQNIFALNEKKLIVGSSTGVFVFDIEKGDFKVISPGLRWVSITKAITKDNAGNIWLANYDGLIKLIAQSDSDSYEETIYSARVDEPFHLRSNRIDDVIIDQKNNVWFIEEGSGLARLEGDKIIYYNDLLNQEELNTVNIINDLYYDDDGLLWIGTEGSELCTINLSTNPFRFVTTKNEKNRLVKFEKIKAVFSKRDQLLLGTLNGSIYQYNLNNNDLNFNRKLEVEFDGQKLDKLIETLLLDKQDNIWLGTSLTSLICCRANGEFNDYEVGGYVFSLMEDHYSNIWFGTWRGGMGYVNTSTNEITKYMGTSKEMLGLSNNVVLSLHETSNGYLLVGTKGGGLNIAPLDQVISKQGSFDVYTHVPGKENSLSHNDIYKIFESKNGEIWLGTGRGLAKLIPAKGSTLEKSLKNGTISFKEITEKDGLPGGIVYTISEDKNGFLWLGTNRGLCRYSREDGNVIEFIPDDLDVVQSYDESAQYNGINSQRLFFGGLNGLVYFNPDSVIHDLKNLPVYFTNLSVLNNKIVPGYKYDGRVILNNEITYSKSIKLKHNEKLFSIEFSSLNTNYLKDKTKYKYRLIGFNDQWIEILGQDRSVTFTNLQSGDYRLQVKASNSDGSWSEKTAELKIVVQPPFWLTPWAYALYLCFILFLLLAFRRYSLIRLKEKNQLQIQELEHRKEVEISEAKIRFFTNVSHEIRTPLTLINEPLRQLASIEELPAEAKDLSGVIMRNMRRLLNQVNRLLELRKMDDGLYTLKHSKISIKELLTKVMYEFELAVKSKNIKVVYNIPEGIYIKADWQLLETVIYNLISNAIKFLPQEGGLLELECETNIVNPKNNENQIRISVADNGPGIPQSEIDHVFDCFYQAKSVEESNIGGTGIGLAIVKEYVELHKGSVTIKNLERGGCRFDIILPFKDFVGDTVEEQIEFEQSGKIKLSKGSYSDFFKEITGGSYHKMVIVEDDIELATYLAEIFKVHFSITHFPDGLSALDNISEIMPDIVITDLMMPQLNGMQLTEKLKENQETSHIPIVMLTAKSEDESKIKGLKFGADSYITKPFNTEVLVAQITSIIKSRNLFKEHFSKNLNLEPAESEVVSAEDKFIKKIMELTEARLEDPTFEVPDIVDEIGMSHSLVLRKFKAITGMSLVEFVRSMRIKKAVQLFKQEKLTVSEVAYRVGFSDPKYFSKCFTTEVGERPSDFIKKHHV